MVAGSPIRFGAVVQVRAVFVRAGAVPGRSCTRIAGAAPAAHDIATACGRHRLRRSMGATGICWNNAGSEAVVELDTIGVRASCA